MKEQDDKFDVQAKCRAVLAVWTERRRGAELCRELGVSQSLLSQWQDRALSGMLEALEPRGAGERQEGPALPLLIKRLLDRKVRGMQVESIGRFVQNRQKPVRTKAVKEESTAPSGG